MYRAPIRGSRICTQREEERRMKRHKERLKKMRPDVDNKAPQRFSHLEQNWKKLQQDEERFSKIDHDNRQLLKKMTEIMQRSSIDNKEPRKGPTSLNRETRRKELMRITEENQRLLTRLQSRKATYSHVEWEDDWQKNKDRIKNISEYPLIETIGPEDGSPSSRGLSQRSKRSSVGNPRSGRHALEMSGGSSQGHGATDEVHDESGFDLSEDEEDHVE